MEDGAHFVCDPLAETSGRSDEPEYAADRMRWGAAGRRVRSGCDARAGRAGPATLPARPHCRAHEFSRRAPKDVGRLDLLRGAPEPCALEAARRGGLRVRDIQV